MDENVKYVTISNNPWYKRYGCVDNITSAHVSIGAFEALLE
jgi:hypothetical protein